MKVFRVVISLLLLAAFVRPCAAESGCRSATASAACPACPSGVACPKTTAASHVANAMAAHGTSATARGPAAGAKRCSMPYGTACDLGASSTSTTSVRVTTPDDAPAAAPHVHAVPAAPAKSQTNAERHAGESHAFGPLFLAHQALML